jgi:hypothetical protein
MNEIQMNLMIFLENIMENIEKTDLLKAQIMEHKM